jgi:3-oxoadipate enol-lactonase
MAWAKLTDVECYFELEGSGQPLLLIPGWGTTCRTWDAVAPTLSPKLSLIKVDNRGVGQSRSKRQPTRMSDFSADLIELLDYLQLDRVHVLGLSLGGVIAQRLAVDHPSRVNRLVLVSSTHQFGPYLTGLAELVARALRRFSLRDFVRTVDLLATSPRFMDDNHWKMEQSLDQTCKLYGSRLGVARQLRSLGNSSFRPDEYQISAPTLMVSGGYDPIIPACYARKTASMIPGSRYLLLPNCGHNPFFEQPENIASKVLGFLDGQAIGELTVPPTLEPQAAQLQAGETAGQTDAAD